MTDELSKQCNEKGNIMTTVAVVLAVVLGSFMVVGAMASGYIMMFLLLGVAILTGLYLIGSGINRFFQRMDQLRSSEHLFEDRFLGSIISEVEMPDESHFGADKIIPRASETIGLSTDGEFLSDRKTG